MRIEEIVDTRTITNQSATDALKREAQQIRVKKAKLAADKSQQRAVKAQQRVRKVQAG
jgi:hypothetical protein